MLTMHSTFQEQKEPNPKSYLTILFWLCVFPCLLSYKGLLVSCYKTSRFLSGSFGSHWDILKFFLSTSKVKCAVSVDGSLRPWWGRLSVSFWWFYIGCLLQSNATILQSLPAHAPAKQVLCSDRTEWVNVTVVWFFWWVISEDFLGTNLHGNKIPNN